MPAAQLPPELAAAPRIAASLVNPTPSMLAELIQARVRFEENPGVKASLPVGVDRDLRPGLPKVGQAAIMLFAQRKLVDSFPLIYTTLALAHPN